MTKRLTEASLKKAIADAAAGQTYDVSDAGAPGLVLRVAPRGPAWAFRATLNGKAIRFRLGGVDLFGLTVARDLAAAATLLVREQRTFPTDAWLSDQLVRRQVIEKAAPAPPPAPSTWTFAEARTAYLAEVQRTRREATWRDRRSMLGLKELAAVEGRPVGAISRQELAGIVAAIHRSGRERHASHLCEALRPMWTWLAGDAQQLRSGVLGPEMSLLRAPERSRREDGDQGTYVPPPAELGRLLALAQAGVVDRTMSDALLLLLVSAQRRRSVVNARRGDFVDEDGVLVWCVPPAHRKTARRLGSAKSHDLPLPKIAGDMVRRRLKAADDAKSESPWLFPGMRPRRSGDEVGHLHADSLTHLLDALPGITAAPHDIRRGFTTHLQDVIGLDESDLKVVLDHSEGRGTDDVTDGSYSKARRLKRKAAILEPWAALLTTEAAKVKLGDLDVIRMAISAAYKRQKTKKAKRKAA